MRNQVVDDFGLGKGLPFNLPPAVDGAWGNVGNFSKKVKGRFESI